MQKTRRNYRHEIAPLWVVSEAARDLGKQSGLIPGAGRLEVLAVAGHHKFLADGYLFDEGRFLQPLTWEPDAWSAVKAACGLARAMFRDQKWDFPVKALDRERLEEQLVNDPETGNNPPYECLSATRRDLSIAQDGRGGRFRDLFVLFKGLLMTADWMASGAVGREDDLDAEKGVVRVAPWCLESHMRDRAGRTGRTFKKYKRFQTDCGKAPGHVIAVAPTGSGKTEGSWLWALNQVEQGHVRKIIVLLPTMVTSNSIHERLRDFSEGHGHLVGLVHSTADLVHESEADRADVRSDLLSESHYFRPVTVGTVDQLLVPLFHAGRWAMKTFAAADAAIVIDEVHAYEPHTLGLITLMIEQLAALGTRFMVMSATMPQALRTALDDALAPVGTGSPGVTLVEDGDSLDSARNTWTTCDKLLSASLLRPDEMGRAVPSPEFLGLWGGRNDRGEPLKILVVVNTVKRCQGLSRALREFGFELTCYHSKFIFNDRREKERRINKCPPRLLIATQVVEVSLDIDFDVLLTECAPIDALVQRAGRVNRARRKDKGRVVVHRHEEGSEKVYGFPPGVLDASWRLCQEIQSSPTERDLTGMVEEIYKGHAPNNDPGFLHIRGATRGAQARQFGVLDAPRPYEDDALLRTRKDDYPQVSVIPEPFADDARAAHPRKRKRYELKVPVWYARKYPVRPDELPVCPMNYDAEFGAELLATEEQPDPGNMIF